MTEQRDNLTKALHHIQQAEQYVRLIWADLHGFRGPQRAVIVRVYSQICGARSDLQGVQVAREEGRAS